MQWGGGRKDAAMASFHSENITSFSSFYDCCVIFFAIFEPSIDTIQCASILLSYKVKCEDA